MTKLLSVIFVSLTILSPKVQAQKKVLTSLPVKSSESLEFTGVRDQMLLDLGKTNSFQGVLTRTDEKGDLRLVDYYSFKDLPASSMDRASCEKFLAGIFGPLDKISLKIAKVEIYLSHTGKTCDAQVLDEDKEAKAPERRVIAGFLHAKPIALVFRLSKKSTQAEQESIHKFWDTLR